jgi:hypothetical protein
MPTRAPLWCRWQSEYKLMLVSLYLHAGAVGPALAWYRLLDIKHIQLDTMSHHVLQGLLGTAQRDASLALFRELAFFHDAHIRDAADMTLTAYRNDTYSKVHEFVRFKERLERSHQRLVGRVEALLIKLAEKADSVTEVQVRPAEGAAETNDTQNHVNCGLRMLTSLLRQVFGNWRETNCRRLREASPLG